MKCNDVIQLLNDAALMQGDGVARSELEKHLSACAECAEIWKAQEMLANRFVPAYPVEVTARLEKAMNALVTPRHGIPARRPILLGLSLAGAAVLAASTLYLWDRAPQTETLEDQQISIQATVAPSPSEVIASPGEERVEEVIDWSATAETVEDSASASTSSLDQYLVLIVVEDPKDQVVAQRLGDFAEKLGDNLKADGLQTVDSTVSNSLPDTGSSHAELARSFGAANVVVIRSEERVGGPIDVMEVFDAESGERIHYAGGNIMLLENIAQLMVIDPLVRSAGLWADSRAARIADSRATFLDSTRPFDERRAALARLQENDALSADETLISEAITLATTSEVDYERQAIWSSLAGVHNSMLIQSLSNALGTDPSERVRAAAANALAGINDDMLIEPLGSALRSDSSERVRTAAATALGEFRADPRAMEALQYSSDYDSDERVRWRAKASALSRAERRQQFLRMDLPVSERLRILDPDSEAYSEIGLDPQIAAALVDIASVSQDAGSREDAVLMLRGAEDSDTSMVESMVLLLNDDSAPGVRRAAITILRRRLESPGVRVALEDVRDHDVDEAVRESAAFALQPPL